MLQTLATSRAHSRHWGVRRPALRNIGGRPCVKRTAVADTEGATASGLRTKQARKYVMVSGKGGVGKTSLSASLAIKFASEGHDTLIVSTDPAHSLGDSLGQHLPGGKPLPIEGTALPLWGMEVDPDLATQEFKSFAATSGKEKVQARRPEFAGP
jgi:Anion-transporting ATPase